MTETTIRQRLAPWLDHRGRPRTIRRINRFLRSFGPGIITGAADDDPSGIGTYSQAGAAFGFSQLWLALYMLPLVIGVQEMCGRIGLVTRKGIAGVIREHYSRPVLYSAVILLFIANTINVGADLGAMAASVSVLIPGIPALAILVIFAIGILLAEIFITYEHYVHILKFFSFSILAYVITGFIINPNWNILLRATLIPTISRDPAFLAIIVGILGTTISPYLFFWQASEEVEEIDQHNRQPRGIDPVREKQSLIFQIRALRFDTIIGMIASVATFWFIVMTTSATLHVHGITNITSADQAAVALEPLVHSFPNAGLIAKLIFAVGIIGTGLLAIPVLAGSAAYGVAESFGWREGLSQPLRHARGFYGVIAASTLIGMLLNLIGVNPIAALVYAAIINGIIAVPLLILILLVANNKQIMGEYTNSMLSNTVNIMTTVAMGIAGVVTIVTLFWH